MRFTCHTCGEEHEGAPDLGFDAPWYYYTVPEAERAGRCRLTPDLCTIDGEDFFVRGCLEVPILGGDEVFAWGLWTSLSEPNFRRYEALFDAPDPGGAGPFFGWLSSRLPGYPDTLLLKLRVHLRGGRQRPALELEPGEHPLAVEQREGITRARLQAIYELQQHGGRYDA